jgi:hypothetical protein
VPNFIELSGKYFSTGEQVPFQVTIGMPEEFGQPEDYLCRVLSPQLFTKSMDVYGVSPDQAVRLALTIVNAALTSLVVTEEDMNNDPGEETTQGSEKGR